MEIDLQLEVKVVRKFVIKNKQDRYVQFLSSEKTRPKFIRDLNHIWRSDLLDNVRGIEEEIVMKQLNLAGIDSKECYIISEKSGIDAQRMPTETALTHVVASNLNSVLVFGDAEMIYIELEGLNHRYISKV